MCCTQQALDAVTFNHIQLVKTWTRDCISTYLDQLEFGATRRFRDLADAFDVLVFPEVIPPEAPLASIC